nr:MAG TPA: hypothetical protein [Caudoviricetes sp.]
MRPVLSTHTTHQFCEIGHHSRGVDPWHTREHD